MKNYKCKLSKYVSLALVSWMMLLPGCMDVEPQLEIQESSEATPVRETALLTNTPEFIPTLTETTAPTLVPSPTQMPEPTPTLYFPNLLQDSRYGWLTFDFEDNPTALDGTWMVQIIRSDGAFRSRLTAEVEKSGWAKWSPDGSMLAFISSDTRPGRIYILDIAQNELQPIVLNEFHDEIGSFEWSNDGSQIVFSVIYIAGEASSGAYYRVSIDDLEPKLITKVDGGPGWMSWSPTTDEILIEVFEHQSDYRYVPYLLHLDGRIERLTLSMPNPSAYDWHPYRREITYSYYTEESLDLQPIHSFNLDTGEDTILVDEITENSDPVWSPDGTRLAFICVDAYYVDKGKICIKNFESGEIIKVPAYGEIHEFLTWSPDGKYLAFLTAIDPSYIAAGFSLNIYSMETGVVEQIIKDGVSHIPPAWMP